MMLLNFYFRFLAAILTVVAMGQSNRNGTTVAPPSGIEGKLDRILDILNDKSLSRPEDVGASSTLFQYLLEELRRAHTKLEGLQTRLNTLETSLENQNQSTRLLQQGFEFRLRVLNSTLAVQEETRLQLLEKNYGSTFIRWGRKNCPSNTTLVYTGVAGGKMYNDKGGGTNRLCLSGRPQYDDTSNLQGSSHVFGAEYQNIGDHHDHDVPCSVCLTPRVSTIMIPATLTCPPGWTPQYWGHLAGQNSWGSDLYATEYVCLDDQPENNDSGVRNDEGLLFYLVVSRCGSLPCPPFLENRVVTCVVCSK